MNNSFALFVDNTHLVYNYGVISSEKLTLSFARSGMINQVIGLRTINYLKNEQEYLPWKSAVNSLGYIDHMLSRSASYGMFQVPHLHK